jgi:hypothetical protein
MGERPEGMSIDRINNNGNYEKRNCRWITQKEQMRNMRCNRLITWKGKTQCVNAWAEELGINRGTFYARISRLRWSIEKAITKPIRTIER